MGAQPTLRRRSCKGCWIAHTLLVFAALERAALPSVRLGEGVTLGRIPSGEIEAPCPVDAAASGVHPPSESPSGERRSLDVGDELLAGRFVLQQRLGRGGMGVVYEAFDRERKGVVALKTLDHVDAFAQNRLKDEFRVLADVVHPNLAELYGLFSDGELCFFTMELVRGRTFRQHVFEETRGVSNSAATVSGRATAALATPRSLPPQPPRETEHVSATHIARLSHAAVRDLFAQLAEGIHAIHESGKLHRDLKPSNVLVTDAGRVVVLDFGLVRDLPEAGTRPVGAGLYAFPENPGLVWGTPEFMAPEQAGGRETTRASDWYAFGVMFYEVLTGQLPFVGDSTFVMTQKRLSDAPDPQWFASELPPDLGALTTRLLAIDQRVRPTFDAIMEVLRPGHTASSPVRMSQAGGRTSFLLGRDSELARLQAAYERARSGEPAVVWIAAPSGLGKTALAQEFVTRLRLCEDAAILSGRCHEREQLPYKALDTVVDQLARFLRQLSETRLEEITPPDLPDLVRAFGALGTVFPQADDTDEPILVDGGARESRRRAFRSLKALLVSVSKLRPLVILIDDLQWGDQDSTRVLEELLTPPDRPAMLFIGAYRSEERAAEPFLRDLTDEMPARVAVNVDRIVLTPLSESVALELAHALIPPAQAHTHAANIVRESAGNPFFLEALVQHQSESGWSVVAAADVSVDTLVRERVVQLSVPARRLLSLLAVAGQPIEQPVALEAAGLTSEAHAAVSALRNGRFVRTRPGLAADEIEPYHDRVRESVHASLAADELRQHHTSLARVLEATGRAEPELLSRHLHGAGDDKRAAEYATVAAEAAARAFAFDRAAEFYRRALEYDPGDRPHERALQTRLGEMLTNAGRGAQAAPAFMAAASGLEGYEALRLQRHAAEQWLASGRIDEGLVALRTVLRAVGLRMHESPGRALLELLFLRAQLRLRGTRFARRANQDIPPADLLRIDSCKAAAWSLGVVDQIQGALFQTRHLLLSLEAGESSRIAASLATQAMFLAGEGGAPARIAALFDQADRLLVGVDETYPRAVMLSARGTASVLTADYAQGRIDLQQAEQMFRERCRGALGEANNARLFWAASLSYLGRWREANERLAGWLADADERGDLYAATTLRLNEVSTLLWLASDDPQTARHDVEQALEGWPHRGNSVQAFYSRVLPVYVELYVGDCRAAMRRIDALLPGFYRSLLGRLKGLRAPVELLAGLSHLSMLKQGFGDRATHISGVRRHVRYLTADSIAYSGVFAAMLRAGLLAVEASERQSVAALRAALERSDALKMAIIGACLRDRLGNILGGDEGREMVQAAATVFVAEGVRRPESLVSMYLSAR